MDLQNKTTRSLNNRLSELRVKMANINSDLKKLERYEAEHESMVRRLKKEIQRKEMELDELKLRSKKFEKDKFMLISNKRNLKKQIQEVIATQRAISSGR